MSVSVSPDPSSNPGDPQIVLASASPRRRALLAQIGVRFAPVVVAADECPGFGESAETYVHRVAAEKSRLAAMIHSDNALPVLGADTEVVLDGEVFGKPESFEQARSMLLRLSGRAHRVLSAVSLRHGPDHWFALSESTVVFRSVTEGEIRAYWASGEPRDKAGAYAIQGLGSLFVRRLEGSFSGVMGLPIFETVDLLAHVGIEPSTLLHSGSV